MKENTKPQSNSIENTKYFKLRIIFPPKTIGKLIKKLNFNASLLLNFLKSKAETVNPERDNPGKTANPCIRPSRILSLLFKSCVSLFPLFVALSCNIPVNINKKPIIKVSILDDNNNSDSSPIKNFQ